MSILVQLLIVVNNRGHGKELSLLTLQRLCTFTLSLNQPKHPIHAECIKERRELRQDLSEGEFNPTSKTRSTYNFATSSCQADELNSHDFVDQDRAHCLKAAREASKLGGTQESLCPWVANTSDYLGRLKAPRQHSTLVNFAIPIHPGVSLS